MMAFAGWLSDRDPPPAARMRTLAAALQAWGPGGASSTVAGPAGLALAWPHCEAGAGFAGGTDRGNALCILADLRLDATAELATAIGARSIPGTDACAGAPAELVLEAYRLHGEDCVSLLHGDFAFAIWDARDGSWFCARDRLGAKPFYYLDSPARFAFSNIHDALRRHASDRPNPQAMADFLLCGVNPELHTSSFAEISVLPPGHRMRRARGDAARCQAYWRLTLPAATTEADLPELVGTLRGTLGSAVEARIPGAARVSVALSGGLDSAAVAALARAACSERNSTLIALSLDDSAHGFTTHEADYAEHTASALGLPFHRLPVGDWAPPAPAARARRYCGPAPVMGIPPSADGNLHAGRTFAGEVVLTGHGADPLFMPDRDYVWRHLRHGATRPLLRAWRLHARHFGARPPLYLRTLARARFARHSQPVLPPWLRADFAARLDLRARQATLLDPAHQAARLAQRADIHPLGRTGAAAQLLDPVWVRLFESTASLLLHDGVVSLRHPWFDLRVIAPMLALPALPWCHDKFILREMLRAHIPPAVSQRRKALTGGEPEHQMLAPHYANWGAQLLRHSSLGEYVDAGKLQRMLAQASRLRPTEYALLARPLYLGYWLAQVEHAVA